MTPKRISEDGLPSLLARLPKTVDLESSAARSRALVRRRGVKSAASLLRLARGCGLGRGGSGGEPVRCGAAQPLAKGRRLAGRDFRYASVGAALRDGDLDR